MAEQSPEKAQTGGCTPCEVCGGDQSRGWHLHGFSPAQVASLEREAFLDSESLDPAWIAGWHAAVDHVTTRLDRVFPPGTSGADQ